MRYAPHIAIAAGVVLCGAIAYYALSGKAPSHPAASGSSGYSENSYCRVVAFSERTKNGAAGPCLRCVTGTYTATRWTSCPIRQSADHPESVECGYNAGQTPTAIAPGAMCAQTESAQPAPTDNRQPEPPQTGSVPADSGSSAAPVTASSPDAALIPVAPPDFSKPYPATKPNPTAVPAGPRGTVVITPTRPPSIMPKGMSPLPNTAGPATRGGYLGITLPRGRHSPARVMSVEPGGGAARANILPGDVILSIQGVPTRTGHDVLDILGKFHPQDQVQLTVRRGGQNYATSVVLGGRPAGNGVAPPPTLKPAASGARVLQVFAQEEARDYWGNLKQEAATIHVVACNVSGRQLFIYDYQNRLAFRAIQPPDFAHALGGRDFDSYEEAIRAGCGG